jgi:hypothetical protein
MLDGLIGPSGWTTLGIESTARERKVDRIALIAFGGPMRLRIRPAEKGVMLCD